MQNHYAVKHMGITIYDFHADNDKAAKKIAVDRFGEYDLLVCFSTNGVRTIGGSDV
jgi:hypothetical protein